jgi:hypothetical protein
VLGAGGEAREVAEVEAGVVAEGLDVVRGRGGFVEAVEGGGDEAVAAASSRSQRAISSSTLVTMRCCSARGGIETIICPSVWPFTFGCPAPLAPSCNCLQYTGDSRKSFKY